MTTASHAKPSALHDRIIPALWVVAYAAVFIALPWRWGIVLIVPLALVACWELSGLHMAALKRSWGPGDMYLDLLYVGIPFCLLVWARAHDGRGMAAYLIMLAFASDTCAYYGGKAIGRHHLLPKISPNKTVEGALIGIVAGALVGWVFQATGVLTCSLHTAIYLSAAFSIAGIWGDYLESWLKRKADVKDSGKLLRGHGGILDRVDALLMILFSAWYPLLHGWLL